MKDAKFFLALLCLIVAAAASRLLPHPPNFTPVTAIALLGALYLRKSWQTFSIPLLALVVSDYFIGFYAYMWAVYAGFLAISLYGYLRARNYSFAGKLLLLVPASLFFFLLTNSAVFFQTDLYPRTVAGYMSCLVAGLPFWRNSLAADLSYGFVLFALAELAQNKFSATVPVARAQAS